MSKLLSPTVQSVAVADWRDGRRTLCERMNYYLSENPEFGDVTFIVGPEPHSQVRVKSLKIILIVQSAVFERMLSDEWVHSSSNERDENGQLVVRLVEENPQAFPSFLKLLLINDLTLNSFSDLNLAVEQVLDILIISRKYCVDGVTRVCEQFVREKITLDNVIGIYTASLGLCDDELELFSFDFILRNAEVLVEQDAFLHLPPNSIRQIVDSDDLEMEETKIFEFLCRLAELQCAEQGWEKTPENIRKSLGDLLYKIRFPIMKPEEFSSVVSSGNILSVEETLALYTYICSREENRNEEKIQSLGFNTKPRALKYSIPENGYPVELFRAADRKTRFRGAFWISTNPSRPTPDGAVSCDYENGRDVLVIRVRLEESRERQCLIPGKFPIVHSSAYISNRGTEIPFRDFQVLVTRPEAGSLVWIPSQDGQPVKNAVIGGVSEDGEILFIGRFRCPRASTLVPGKIQPSRRLCSIPWGCQEWTSGTYEILVGLEKGEELPEAGVPVRVYDFKRLHHNAFGVYDELELAEDYNDDGESDED